MAALVGASTDKNVPGVKGVKSVDGIGVAGNGSDAGVLGQGAHGVRGEGGHGVVGISKGENIGVLGEATDPGGTGVVDNNFFLGNAQGLIAGQVLAAPVAYGKSEKFGVLGITNKADGIGVFGTSVGGVGIAVRGDAGGGLAGSFIGNVEITGKLNMIGAESDIILQGADCAEDFDIVGSEAVEPGTVMVIDSEGILLPSSKAYDNRVAGVVSGAGNQKAGIVLDKRQTQCNRMPIALVGKVLCRVDAQYSPIEVGDFLTTSESPAYAMKADDPHKAFGSAIGKALRPPQQERGLFPFWLHCSKRQFSAVSRSFPPAEQQGLEIDRRVEEVSGCLRQVLDHLSAC